MRTRRYKHKLANGLSPEPIGGPTTGHVQNRQVHLPLMLNKKYEENIKIENVEIGLCKDELKHLQEGMLKWERGFPLGAIQRM